MTAEFVLLNQEAVALAADSALSTGDEGTYKVFNSANKLFCLSHTLPIGVMVYGGAKFRGVPWEAIVKLYRETLDDEHFATVEHHARHFLAWLQSASQIAKCLTEDESLTVLLDLFYTDIRNRIAIALDELKSGDDKGFSDAEAEAVETMIIEEESKKWVEKGNFVCPLAAAEGGATNGSAFTEVDVDRFRERRGKIIASAIERIFRGRSERHEGKRATRNPARPLPEELQKKLLGIGAGLPFKRPRRWFPTWGTGIVFAGFGREEMFPSVATYHVSGVIEKTLIYSRVDEECKVVDWSSANESFLIPLAEGDASAGFLLGVEPDYQEELMHGLKRMRKRMLGVIGEAMGGDETDRDRVLLDAIDTAWGEEEHVLEESLFGYQYEVCYDPLLRVIADVPKDDLAATARALVELAWLKKRIRGETETVGGAVDVAIISKGDGLIWIDRKHYFDAKKNPAFIARYYTEKLGGAVTMSQGATSGGEKLYGSAEEYMSANYPPSRSKRERRSNNKSTTRDDFRLSAHIDRISEIAAKRRGGTGSPEEEAG